jgi:hypothetical protein
MDDKVLELSVMLGTLRAMHRVSTSMHRASTQFLTMLEDHVQAQSGGALRMQPSSAKGRGLFAR